MIYCLCVLYLLSICRPSFVTVPTTAGGPRAGPDRLRLQGGPGPGHIPRPQPHGGHVQRGHRSVPGGGGQSLPRRGGHVGAGGGGVSGVQPAGHQSECLLAARPVRCAALRTRYATVCAVCMCACLCVCERLIRLYARLIRLYAVHALLFYFL